MSLSVIELLKYAVPSVFGDSKKLQNNFASEIYEDIIIHLGLHSKEI